MRAGGAGLFWLAIGYAAGGLFAASCSRPPSSPPVEIVHRDIKPQNVTDGCEDAGDPEACEEARVVRLADVQDQLRRMIEEIERVPTDGGE